MSAARPPSVHRAGRAGLVWWADARRAATAKLGASQRLRHAAKALSLNAAQATRRQEEG